MGIFAALKMSTAVVLKIKANPPLLAFQNHMANNFIIEKSSFLVDLLKDVKKNIYMILGPLKNDFRQNLQFFTNERMRII